MNLPSQEGSRSLHAGLVGGRNSARHAIGSYIIPKQHPYPILRDSTGAVLASDRKPATLATRSLFHCHEASQTTTQASLPSSLKRRSRSKARAPRQEHEHPSVLQYCATAVAKAAVYSKPLKSTPARVAMNPKNTTPHWALVGCRSAVQLRRATGAPTHKDHP